MAIDMAESLAMPERILRGLVRKLGCDRKDEHGKMVQDGRERAPRVVCGIGLDRVMRRRDVRLSCSDGILGVVCKRTGWH